MLLVPYVATVVGFIISPTHSTKEFWSTSAGVLPVVLLLLAFQFRTFQLLPIPFGRDSTTQARVRLYGRLSVGVGVLLVLVVAELHALRVLAIGVTPDNRPGTMFGALVGGFVTVAMFALIGPPTATEPTNREEAST